MKKLLLTGAVVLASFFGAQAQTLINNNFGTDQATFTEAFTGWGSSQLSSDTDANFWRGTLVNTELQGYGFTGVVMYSASFVNTGTTQAPVYQAIQPANFILSPTVDATADQPLNLSFRIGSSGDAATSIQEYTIWALTAEQLAAEEGVDLTAIEPVSSGVAPLNGAAVVTANLDAYAGESIGLLILHTSGSETSIGNMFIDDILLVSGTAGTEEVVFSSSALSVFPNPTNGVVTIANSDNILVNGVTVADLNGRTVKTASFAGVTEAQVNISDLSAGVYMMTISSDKGTTTKKIVKN